MHIIMCFITLPLASRPGLPAEGTGTRMTRPGLPATKEVSDVPNPRLAQPGWRGCADFLVQASRPGGAATGAPTSPGLPARGNDNPLVAPAGFPAGRYSLGSGLPARPLAEPPTLLALPLGPPGPWRRGGWWTAKRTYGLYA